MHVEEPVGRDSIGFIWDTVNMLQFQSIPIAALCTEAIPVIEEQVEEE